MAGESPDVARLRTELQRLHAGLVHWSGTRWTGRAADDRSRSDVVFALVLDLSVLGARAGSGAPPTARPPRLGHHALADQLMVVAGELVAAPRAAEVAPDALAAVTSARRLLGFTI